MPYIIISITNVLLPLGGKNNKTMSKQDKPQGIRYLFDDVEDSISWLDIAERYFDRSSSWLYQKLGGYSSNGGFTPEEMETLRGALCDLADRLRAAADKLPRAEA